MFLKKFLAVIVFLLFSARLAFAAGPITIEKVTEKFDPKTNEYTYTVVIKNTGNLVPDYYVTAQPYDDKSLGEDGKPKDSAKRQIKKVTLGGHQKTTVKFVFSGAEGKNWKFKYTDVYDSDPTKGGAKMIVGDIGEFALRQVPPGTTGDQAFAFQFPYPYAAGLLHLGPTDFYIDITEQSLPATWELASFSPIPGNLFTLDYGQVQVVEAAFHFNAPILDGEKGFVKFDFVNPASGLRWNSEVGVVGVVPEPATIVLLGFGIVSMAFHQRKPRQDT